MLATLIADDLTGACDAGAPFAGRGRVGVFVAPASPGPEWDVAAVDTESRGLEPAEAAELVGAAAGRLGTRLARGLLFKKIDSTLRGPVGAELEALLSASGRRTALLCPAFPGQQRAVLHGTLRVSGVPAHETPVGRDPTYPGPTSDVPEILRRGAIRPISFLPLVRVRGGHDDLVRALRGAGDEIIVADAETDGDLESLAGAALGCPELVLAGSAGLARAAAAALGYAGPPVPLPDGHAWLIVAGSLHPATRAQLRALEAAGVTGVRLDGPCDPDARPLIGQIKDGRPVFIATGDVTAAAPGARHAAASRLALVAARVLAESRPDLVAVTGGETAVALLRAVGATRLTLSGAPSSGLALGDAIVDSAWARPAARRPRLGSNIEAASTLPLLTKAGGFGPPDLFLTLLNPALASPGGPPNHFKLASPPAAARRITAPSLLEHRRSHVMAPHLPLLGITMGDPAGVGPEITAKALTRPGVTSSCRTVVIGDRSVMAATLELLRSPLELHAVRGPAECRFSPGTIECLDLGKVDAARLLKAAVSAEAGRAAYAYIETGVKLCQSGEIDGLVTAPINKEALAAAGVQHSGHTEILAKLSGTTDFAMLLMGKELKVIHVTTHVALRQVPDLVTRERVLRVIHLAERTMKGLGQPHPKIAVCGLNPHAGEDGLFGDEEKIEIIPAIEQGRREGLAVYGPLPADTLFSRARGGEFDIVVAMYHDQGHVPVKTLGFTYDEAAGTWTGLSGVNVTVGLPFLRVSVDHGTAFDRAWQGIANPESMVEALEVAVRMLAARAG